MKKNETFDIPQRQSQLAIIFIILRVFGSIVKQIWPIFLVFMLGGSQDSSSTFSRIEIALSGLGVIGVIPAIISYFKYYFHLTDTDLVINKGLIKKVKLNIPFERIQSVNFNQNFLHQLLGVTEVEIETAGSDSQETKIDALDMQTAEALRERILLMKGQVDVTTAAAIEGIATEQEVSTPKETILSLDHKDLLRVGLVQNHLRPLGVLTGVLFTLYFYTGSFTDGLKEIIQRAIDPIVDFKELWSSHTSTSIMIIAGLLLGSFIVSVVSTVLKYYNLSFWRTGSKFQVVHGLFNRREYAALDNKIQILKWGQNILERFIGFYNITFAQAKSDDGEKGKGAIKIPGCSDAQVQYVKEAWLGPEAMQGLDMKKVSPHLFYRSATYQIVILLGLGAVFYYFKLDMQAAVALCLLPILLMISWLQYKKKRYGFNKKEIYVGGGTIGLRHALLPTYKIQGVKIKANPYQWRRKLASLVIYTAGGRIIIPYIPHAEAVHMMDDLLYQVEKAKQPWM